VPTPSTTLAVAARRTRVGVSVLLGGIEVAGSEWLTNGRMPLHGADHLLADDAQLPRARYQQQAVRSYVTVVRRNGYWTTREYANSRIASLRTGHLADWSTSGLDNSPTSQHADWTSHGLDNSRIPTMWT